MGHRRVGRIRWGCKRGKIDREEVDLIGVGGQAPVARAASAWDVSCVYASGSVVLSACFLFTIPLMNEKIASSGPFPEARTGRFAGWKLTETRSNPAAARETGELVSTHPHFTAPVPVVPAHELSFTCMHVVPVSGQIPAHWNVAGS
jgi:hypothetical protein